MKENSQEKVKSLSITTNNLKINQGSTQQLTVTAKMEDGSEKDVTEDVEYKSSNASRATVDANGLLTAHGVSGTVDITAKYRGVSKTIRITVMKN